MDYIKRMVFKMIELYGSCYTWNDKLREMTIDQAIEIYLYAGQQLSNEVVNQK